MSFGKSLVVQSESKSQTNKPADAGKALAKAGSSGAPLAVPKVASSAVVKKIQDAVDSKKGGTVIAFAIDATASRSENWAASQIAQAKMFKKAASMGSMKLSIAFHRGSMVETLGTFSKGEDAAAAMANISCVSGSTKIEGTLSRCMNMNVEALPSSIIMVGDCCEDCHEDSQHTRLFDRTAELAQKNIKVYAVHDPHGGDNGHGAEIYKKIAQITGGSFVSIDDDIDFANICEAIAVLEVGGLKKFQELIAQGNSAAKKLAAGGTRLLGGPGMK